MLFRFEINAPIAQIIADLKKIPPNIVSLDLRNNFLGQKTVEEFQAILEAIPKSVTAIDLGSNMLGQKKTRELVHIFRTAMPKSLKWLNLSDNFLGQKTVEEFQAILEAIPESITGLDLGGNILGQKNTRDLVHIFRTAIPKSVKWLNLSGNDLISQKSTDELVQIFRALPRGLNYLDLTSNGLGKIETEGLLLIMEELPEGLKALNLGYQLLNTRNAKDCARILAILPQWLEFLDLSGNGLGKIEMKDLVLIMNELPKTLTSLNLSGNQFGIQSAEALEKFFEIEIFTGLTKLNLGYNDLFMDKKFDKCERILKAIPRQLEFVDLSGNGLGLQPDGHILPMLKSIPPSLKKINLSNNLPGFGRSVEFSQILSEIRPESIFLPDLLAVSKLLGNTIFIGEFYNPLSNFLLDLIVPEHEMRRLLASYETPAVLGAATAQAQPQTQLARADFRPPFHINEENLSELIAILEVHPSPRSDLVCALLLEYKIPNSIFLTRDQGYRDQRTCLAIDFFQRAACTANAHLSAYIKRMMLNKKQYFTDKEHPIYHKLSAFVDRSSLPKIDLETIRALLNPPSSVQPSVSAESLFKRKTVDTPEPLENSPKKAK